MTRTRSSFPPPHFRKCGDEAMLHVFSFIFVYSLLLLEEQKATKTPLPRIPVLGSPFQLGPCGSGKKTCTELALKTLQSSSYEKHFSFVKIRTAALHSNDF